MYFVARKNSFKTEVVYQYDDIEDAKTVADSYNDREAVLDIESAFKYRYFVATLTEVE